MGVELCRTCFPGDPPVDIQQRTSGILPCAQCLHRHQDGDPVGHRNFTVDPRLVVAWMAYCQAWPHAMAEQPRGVVNGT